MSLQHPAKTHQAFIQGIQLDELKLPSYAQANIAARIRQADNIFKVSKLAEICVSGMVQVVFIKQVIDR